MNQQFSNPYCDKGRMVRSSWTSKYFPFELKTVINVAKSALWSRVAEEVRDILSGLYKLDFVYYVMDSC
jgi:hypothetical protein